MSRSACFLVLAWALAASAGCGSDDPAERASPERKLELRDNRHGGIYMGVRCRTPNSVRCDRVGLAVWLARPAQCLVAQVEGRRIELVSPGEFVPGEGTGWEGELHPAGLSDAGGPLEVAPEPGEPHDYWSGRKPVEAKIRLTALYPDGTSATRTIRAPLHPGWG
jgi:hypothetical protein